MANSVATVDEIIAALRKSSIPTVIIEGPDDSVVYRRIEDIHSRHMLDVLPVGGRSALLEIFERRSEFAENKNVVFAADRDSWVYTDVPDAYKAENLVFTDGYSIENDVIRDTNAQRYMTAAERADFEKELTIFIRGYGPKVDHVMSGVSESLSDHPNEFFNRVHLGQIDAVSLPEVAHSNMGKKIHAEFEKLLRGKTLMGLMMRQLSKKGRVAQLTKISIFEVAGANPGKHVSRLFDQLSIALNLPE